MSRRSSQEPMKGKVGLVRLSSFGMICGGPQTTGRKPRAAMAWGSLMNFAAVFSTTSSILPPAMTALAMWMRQSISPKDSSTRLPGLRSFLSRISIFSRERVDDPGSPAFQAVAGPTWKTRKQGSRSRPRLIQCGFQKALRR